MKKELKTDDLAYMLQNITLIIIKTEKKKENSETKLIFKK